MDNKTLMRAANWMGYGASIRPINVVGAPEGSDIPVPPLIEKVFIDVQEVMSGEWPYSTGTHLFNPNEDANLLKKMELKLNPEQFSSYRFKMFNKWAETDETKMLIEWEKWFKCEAETKLCFSKIMEVI